MKRMHAAKIVLIGALGALASLGHWTLVRPALAQETPRTAAAPDAFYLSLLRDGRAEMLRGDALAARKSFRLACFGFLEQPVVLAEGLVRLGLAEAALGDREAFVATFSRLTEVEERFAAYAAAAGALSADERRVFEGRALEWVTPEVLRSLPSFAPLLARKSEVDLSQLAPRERTRELEKRAAAEPGVARWKVLLAADDAANDRAAKALVHLEGVPDAAEQGSAGCLRGRALARLKRCDEAVVALAACVPATSDALLAEAHLTCLVALERSDAARAFAARITRPAADAPAVRKAIARLPEPRIPAPTQIAPPPAVAKPPGAAAKPPDAVAKPPAAPAKPPKKTPAVASPPAPPSQPSPPSQSSQRSQAKASPSRLTAEEERVVATAQGLLKTVENRDELRQGLALVQPVADRLPERGDLQLLAGEIAYRAGLWTTGADYFRRSTPERKGPTDPTQRFYYAVCLYEAGDRAGAAAVAATGLEKLARLPFVEAYLAKIRAAAP